jgi:esterase/lipase
MCKKEDIVNFMKKFIFLLFTLSVNFAGATDNCETNRNLFLDNYENLYTEYKKTDSNFSMDEHKKAFWITGLKNPEKAIFIAHGYMGSPQEMMYAIEPFKKDGWSIVSFLIPGHGATYEIANSLKNVRWTNEMKKQMDLVTSCFKEVRAIGFSTGGLLLHHYLLTNPTPHSLKSMHYISPYFVQRFGGFFDTLLTSLVNGADVGKLYFFTRFRDLKVMTIDKENYNQTFPADTALQVKELGLKVFNEMKAETKLTIPVQLFLSEGDWTVDTDSTKLVLNRDYEDVKLVWYKGSEPHHLMCPSVSTIAPELQQLIYTFH